MTDYEKLSITLASFALQGVNLQVSIQLAAARGNTAELDNLKKRLEAWQNRAQCAVDQAEEHYPHDLFDSLAGQ
jgi:phage shock protein A